MSREKLLLSPKYKAFLAHQAAFECMEGTTASGKTTVGLYKFILKVWTSPKKLHLLAADDTGTAEKNIIQKDLGILDDFGKLVEYRGNGSGEYRMPHLIVHATGGDKIIFVVGYRDAQRWRDALGGQYGCLYIDEINTANMDFIREAVMRADYTLCTLNPDDPELPVYKEFINRCRPVDRWQRDTPKEILDELKEPEHPGWVHWFFTFGDNLGLTEEKREQIISTVPPGTKIWKNKAQGLRGKATGLIFSNFDPKKHVRSKEWAQQFKSRDSDRRLTREQLRKAERFLFFSAAVDTAYSQVSPDTIAMSFLGITNKGRCIVLDERVYNNAQLAVPIAPSDTVKNLIDFLERNRKEWGFAKDVFIDSADQATITECMKYKRIHGTVYNFVGAWKKEKIIDRINTQLGWFADAGSGPCFYVLDHCRTYIHELGVYSWKEDKDNEPEDRNDHMVNSVQYGWLPYEKKIGVGRMQRDPYG